MQRGSVKIWQVHTGSYVKIDGPIFFNLFQVPADVPFASLVAESSDPWLAGTRVQRDPMDLNRKRFGEIWKL